MLFEDLLFVGFGAADLLLHGLHLYLRLRLFHRVLLDQLFLTANGFPGTSSLCPGPDKHL